MSCAKCGAPLKVGQTMRVPDEQAEKALQHGIDHARLRRGTIALYFVGKGEPQIIEVSEKITLGRYVPGHSPPTVDLSEYHAGLMGVSRQHAAITPHGRAYVITDLESTNGTWVNQEKLVPLRPYMLRSGDQLQLGQLILFIHFTE